MIKSGECSSAFKFNVCAINNLPRSLNINVLVGLLVCFFVLARQPPVDHGLLVYEVSRSHTTTHHYRQGSSGRVISSSKRPLPDKTQHSQQTDIHANGGIRTHNLSRRATSDLRLRPRGHWDRHKRISILQNRGMILELFVKSSLKELGRKLPCYNYDTISTAA